MNIILYIILFNIHNRKMISKNNLMRAIEGEAKFFPKVKSLINFDGDDVSVNWEKVAECQVGRSSLVSFVGTVLLELEKLLWESKGNYELIQNGRSVNPYSAPKAYFEKKKDALAYREALKSEAISDEEKLNLRVFPINLVQYLD